MSTTTIPSEFNEFIGDALASGRYRSQEEIVVSALRLLREREEKQEALRRDLEIGITELDRGERLSAEEVARELSEHAAEKKGISE